MQLKFLGASLTSVNTTARRSVEIGPPRIDIGPAAHPAAYSIVSISSFQLDKAAEK